VIVIIDNYDSFTHNLVQRLGEIGLAHTHLRHDIAVFRNDKITLDQLADLRPTHLVISPGPCTPTEGGVSTEAIRAFYTKIPVLGVCLGHQCIAKAFGAPVVRARRIMHGKTSAIHHDGRGLFRDLTNPFVAARYHSLTIDAAPLNGEFEITARADDDECMGIRHRRHPLEGVQFHPESFLSPQGTLLLSNFLKL
jgi:para-aminobenzoate synthetase component 2